MNFFPFNRPAFVELLRGSKEAAELAESYRECVRRSEAMIKHLEEWNFEGATEAELRNREESLVLVIVNRESCLRLARLHEAAATCNPFSLQAWRAVR